MFAEISDAILIRILEEVLVKVSENTQEAFCAGILGYLPVRVFGIGGFAAGIFGGRSDGVLVDIFELILDGKGERKFKRHF